MTDATDESPVSEAAEAIIEDVRENAEAGPHWAVTVEKLALGAKSPEEMDVDDWLAPLHESDGDLVLEASDAYGTGYLIALGGTVDRVMSLNSSDNYAGPFETPRSDFKRMFFENDSELRFVAREETPLGAGGGEPFEGTEVA